MGQPLGTHPPRNVILVVSGVTERAPRRKTCTYHCGSCQRHFHSLRSFDSHEPGKCRKPEKCINRKSKEPLLQVWTEDGWCSLDIGGMKHPVTIWQEYGAQQRFGT